MTQPALELRAVVRRFAQAGETLEILKGATLALSPGECVGLMAPSGAGKSTLLHVAGLLDRPDDGDVAIGGAACGRLSDTGRTAIRRKALGFIYQFHHLLPEFSALENVVVPQLIAGTARSDAEARGKTLLDQVGLSHRLDHRPARLSGGEQQRVAIVRALANGPQVLLAD